MKKIFTYLIIALIAYIVFKSLIISVISIDDYILLEKIDNMGQLDRVLFTPQEEMIYLKKYQDITETGIYSLTGQKATHYFLGFYCFGASPLGLRYYNSPEYVYDSTMKLEKKHGNSFPNIGESYKARIIIYKDKAQINNNIYKRLPISNSERKEIIALVNNLKSIL